MNNPSMTPKLKQRSRMVFSASTALTMAIIIFLLMLVVSSGLLAIVTSVFSLDVREQMLTGVWIQDICAFCLPALIILKWFAPNQLRGIPEAKLSFFGSWQSWIMMLLVMCFALPMLNQTIAWNESLKFSGPLYDSLRTMEQTAAEATNTMLSGATTPDLVFEVLTIGVITGISEELFFRHMLMPLISRTSAGKHAAVWITAVIFSAIHFQFFGFLPRLLMGAMFGYIYMYSRSLWPAAGAHILNNSLVVVTTWLALRGYELDLESFGVSDGIPIFATLSTIATIFFFIIWARYRKNG